MSPNSARITSDAGSVMLRCQQGDQTAERELYDSTCGWIYRLVTRMVGANDADDVCQQVYLQVFSKIGSFGGQSEASTWLYRVAVNEALQHLRRRRRSKAIPLDVDPAKESNVPGHLADRELLERALAAVAPELKAVFLLREQEQLSYREISELLQIPEGTVASRVSRARSELQAALKALGWRP